MAAYCGSVVYGITGSKVDLSNPDFELFVEVRGDETYIFHQIIQGLGGLPVGTQGRVISLISSGIDSPVATFLMMKRVAVSRFLILTLIRTHLDLMRKS